MNGHTAVNNAICIIIYYKENSDSFVQYYSWFTAIVNQLVEKYRFAVFSATRSFKEQITTLLITPGLAPYQFSSAEWRWNYSLQVKNRGMLNIWVWTFVMATTVIAYHLIGWKISTMSTLLSHLYFPFTASVFYLDHQKWHWNRFLKRIWHIIYRKAQCDWDVFMTVTIQALF